MLFAFLWCGHARRKNTCRTDVREAWFPSCPPIYLTLVALIYRHTLLSSERWLPGNELDEFYEAVPALPAAWMNKHERIKKTGANVEGSVTSGETNPRTRACCQGVKSRRHTPATEISVGEPLPDRDRGGSIAIGEPLRFPARVARLERGRCHPSIRNENT